MHKVIELTPYLPTAEPEKSHVVFESVSHGLITGAEIAVTLLIGICFFVSTCAFVHII